MYYYIGNLHVQNQMIDSINEIIISVAEEIAF